MYSAAVVPEAMIVREDVAAKRSLRLVGFRRDHYEPGSHRRVLKNLLGITGKREMDQLEGREQVRALEELAASYGKDHRFTAADICRIHTIWLGGIYAWAGRYRQVNVKKGTFSFAAAARSLNRW